MKMAAEQIILKPALTEKSEELKYTGKYVFFVSPKANRIEVAEAIEEIYNRDKKKDKDRIKVVKVNMISVHGKSARSGFRSQGHSTGSKEGHRDARRRTGPRGFRSLTCPSRSISQHRPDAVFRQRRIIATSPASCLRRASLPRCQSPAAATIPAVPLPTGAVVATSAAIV